MFLFFLTNSLIAQYIASQKGDKVEIYDIKGKYITSAYYSHLKDIAQGDEIIVLWYESNKVEVRSYDLKYIASGYYSDLKKINTTGDNVMLYCKNDKIKCRIKI